LPRPHRPAPVRPAPGRTTHEPSSPPPRARFRDHALALAPALVAGLALYAPSLRLFFAQDDVTFLSRAAGLAPTPWSLARPLSEGLAWRALYALFGLSPAPYHALRLALHLASAALVYAIGLRLLRGRGEAGAAAFLFATSSLAFAVLHWASCIVEALVTTLALAAFALQLSAIARSSRARTWAAALVAVAALLAKENAVGLPVVFALAAALMLPPRAALRASLPVACLFAALGLAFLATRALLPYGQYAEAYALALAPAALFSQLCFYLRLCLFSANPVGQSAAAAGASPFVPALLVMAALAVSIWAERGAVRRPAALGAAWFTVFLLPVLPLAHHESDYYLYLPWAGLCWLLPSAYGHVAARWPRNVGAAAAVSALAVIGALQWAAVRAREGARLGPLPADKTMRESLLLRNASAGLRAARLAPGADVGFVNPYQQQHGSLAGAPSGSAVRSYIPLEAAMRGGESLRLFAPGTRYLGFAIVPPPEWDRAHIFFFDNDGTLTALGTPPAAYRALAALFEEEGAHATAESLRGRALALEGAAPGP